MTFLFLFLSCKEETRSPDTRTATTDKGSYIVSYVPTPDPIPLSQDFSLEITITDLEENILYENIVVEATADMPEHGHGMPQEPEIALEDTLFIAEGFFFQMAGDWNISIYVSEMLSDGTTNIEQATFDVTCCQ